MKAQEDPEGQIQVLGDCVGTGWGQAGEGWRAYIGLSGWEETKF
jgi:hypothetical protein